MNRVTRSCSKDTLSAGIWCHPFCHCSEHQTEIHWHICIQQKCCKCPEKRLKIYSIIFFSLYKHICIQPLCSMRPIIKLAIYFLIFFHCTQIFVFNNRFVSGLKIRLNISFLILFSLYINICIQQSFCKWPENKVEHLFPNPFFIVHKYLYSTIVL